jgi:hypothetical protein
MALHILGKDETQVQFLLRAPARPLVKWISCLASNQAVGVRSSQGRPYYKYRMKLYEATIRSKDGKEFKDRVGAQTAQEARLLLQMKYGPRAVPYLPKLIPS